MPPDTIPCPPPDDALPVAQDLSDRCRQLLAIPEDVRRMAIPPPPADWSGFASPELDE